ncbi:MAG: dephospho-CoA kinase [Oscillospiraceae bacterium]|nr:dephospho-CoA kinase [Oscillospiraceae bacterium]
MLVFGITGGSGSGKTSVLNVFGKLGAKTIDCDALYAEMLRSDEGLCEEIKAAFGDDVCAPDGTLDRNALGKKVFGDTEKLKLLDSITFKRFQKNVDGRIDKWRTEGEAVAAIDGATMIYARRYGMFTCNKMIGVVAPEDVRAGRVMARDGIDMETALKRIRSQEGEKFYRDNCEIIIENDSESREEFENAITPVIMGIISKTEEETK